MYVGRIVAVGQIDGKPLAAYRVSSRSFPNRRAKIGERIASVGPIDPSDLARNPYIAYNCIRVMDEVAVVSNGSHTDPIAEKIEIGYPLRDAIALTLLAMDYEKDHLKTPRIAGAASPTEAYLGIVTHDRLLVEKVEGTALVATYEKTEPENVDVDGRSADELARAMYDLSLERPVCAAAALLQEDNWELGVYNGV